MTSRIYIFRHGSALSPPDLMVGRADFALSEEGRRQAEYWRDNLGLPFTLALTSPLERAAQTASIILSARPDNAQPRPVAELIEISLGRWEGLSKEWIQDQYPEEWKARGLDIINFRPPGGESFTDLAARAWPVFRSLAHAASGHDHTLVVTHRAVIATLLQRLPGDWPDNPLDLDLPPASLTILSVDQRGWLKYLERRFVDGSRPRDRKRPEQLKR